MRESPCRLTSERVAWEKGQKEGKTREIAKVNHDALVLINDGMSILPQRFRRIKSPERYFSSPERSIHLLVEQKTRLGVSDAYGTNWNLLPRLPGAGWSISPVSHPSSTRTFRAKAVARYGVSSEPNMTLVSESHGPIGLGSTSMRIMAVAPVAWPELYRNAWLSAPEEITQTTDRDSGIRSC